VKVEFKESFKRDIKKIKERQIKDAVLSLISTIEKSSKPQDIPHIVKTHCNNNFRIKIGSYRIGVVFEENMVILVRCLHRKDFYRFFP